jgi:hypothetical protein
MVERWSTMITVIKILKDSMSHKHSRYKPEILCISDDIDCLNVSLARLKSLVGSAADGIQFNLFGIVNSKNILPRVTGVEKMTEAVEK